MSLLQGRDLQEDRLVGKYFVGVVVDNDDSESEDGLKLGRVRVRIPEIFGEIPTAELPWASVLRRVQNGAIANVSTFHVPDVDSRVVVVFDKGDVYSPLVVGELVGSQTNFEETTGSVFGDDEEE